MHVKLSGVFVSVAHRLEMVTGLSALIVVG
jgi:hypothetical protein